jgi:hypothetical protein
MIAARPHGPLPVLLVCLTVVTGLVDAFSYLSLGHVFVANMTGNVVFLGFALAGVGEISIVASLLAVLAFALGATLGRRWASGREVHRGHLLAGGTAVQARPRSGCVHHCRHHRRAGLGGAADVGRAARSGYGRPERRRTALRRARLDHDGAHLDGHRSGRRHHIPVSTRQAAALGRGDARGCVDRRCPAALGRRRRAALVGGSVAGRLCCRPFPRSSPPTIAGLAVTRGQVGGRARGPAGSTPTERPAFRPHRPAHGNPCCPWSASVTTVRSRSPSP